MTHTYKIAQKAVQIHSLYDEIHHLCRAYRSDEPWNFEVKICPEDIERERQKSASEDLAEGHPIRHFSDGYLETLAVYRKIAEQMLTWDTLLFHGSVIAVDGVGYLFTAKSGTGKSTHTRLWRELFGERAVMVNDDKPLLKITDQGVTVFGTPWDGKHRLSTNMSVPLKTICLLNRGTENRIERISAKEAYPMLVQQSYRPQEPQKLLQTMRLIDRMSHAAELYNLFCNMDKQAAEVAYQGMNQGKDPNI